MMELYLFFIGTCLASFLGLVVDRYPHQSLVFPRSHCSHCQHPLRVWDLIPLLSQVVLAFRCRYCKRKTSPWYALFEGALGFLAVQVYYQHLDTAFAIFLVLGFMLSIYDLRSRSYPLMVWLVATLIALPFTHLSWHCALFLGLALFSEYKQLGIGAGDWLFLASLSLILSFLSIVWLIQIASLLAIPVGFHYRKSSRPLPFIPFLYLAFLLVSLFQIGF